MKLVESILTKNPCYTAGKKITVKGLMLHSVGCAQPKASVFINSWNSPSYSSACVHGFIDGNDGTVYQTLPWDHRGWHCGSGSKGSGNNTHIGVEMCEPACIKYTSGSNFTCSDKAAAQAVAKRTYEAAVELFAYLCKKYGLDPTADGVIISHKEGHSRGIASNHGDPEHLWSQLGMGYTMDGFRKAVKAAMNGNTQESSTSGLTKIMGTAAATAAQMQAYIKSVNTKVAQSVLDMIPLYLSEGKAEGVRGDIAFAQSCLETGNFGFSGSAVTLDQNNFCGMGVTSNGMKGNSFDSPQIGIRAQVQHLKAYASTEALKNAAVDPRFQYVTRGCAKYVEWLGQKENPDGKGWATGSGYGSKILKILDSILAMGGASGGGTSSSGTSGSSESAGTNKSFPKTPFTVQVIVSDLNYRSKGSMDGTIKGQTGKGTFTITEVKNGWGKLKSGAGWIYLENALYVTIGSTVKEEKKTSSVPYQVRVTAKDLNIRKGPGTNYDKTGKYTGPGTFTIVEEKSGKGSDKGWGKLKSGAGWISLDFCTKV